MKKTTLRSLPALLLACAGPVVGLTVTKGTGSIVVDTGSTTDFVVTIDTSSCDITSLTYGGTEYQDGSGGSQISSGLGSATVSYKVSSSGDNAVVTCAASGLTHYHVFKDGEAAIYMGTDVTSEPSVGELRFIFRLKNLFSCYPFGDASNIIGGTAIEASDVYMVGSQTRSKFYSSERFIDDKTYCATNSAGSVHACFSRPNHQASEKSSGGPFHRDIDCNPNGASTAAGYNSLTFYMNSNHVQTEASLRTGFFGPYVFSMSGGVASASSFDVSIFDSLALGSYVGPGKRGTVSGTASGTDSGKPIVVHWFNSGYQFWAKASGSGAFSSPPMPAGTYTMNLYQDELLAGSSSVAVTAGGAKTANIAATNAIVTKDRTTVFQLGDYDGRPAGFRNAANQLRMHPSDTRMSSWTPGSVASSAAASWPMAIWQDINDGQNITFSLTSDLAVATTLRVATTLSFAGGRPVPVVNGFACADPGAPTKIDSRGVTRGAYRGNGDVYTCTIPAGTLVSGVNTVTINIASGESGTQYLSPNVIFDAIELFH